MKVLQRAVALASYVPWLTIPPAASAIAVPRALVLSARATPVALGPSGGQVAVTGTVRHAGTCQLELLSRQSFPVVYSHNPTTACRSGRYSAHVTIGANTSRGEAHRRLRPGGPQRALQLHGPVLCFPGAVSGPDRPVRSAPPRARWARAAARSP